MKIIDFRIRPPFKDFLGTAMYAGAERRDRMTRSIGFTPSLAAQERSIDLLIQEMDQAGVTHGVVVGRESGSLGSVDNAVVKEFCDTHSGRFIPVASIDPTDRRKAATAIDTAIAAGFKAFNIEPGGATVPMHTDDRRLYPIYAHLEDRGLPLIIMTGGNAGPDISFTSPEHLDRVLADFPALRIVSSHGNWPWVHQILHIAFRRPNLYLSPDYLLANLPGMDDYVRAADGWLADRILYASAFPFAPVHDYAKWFQKLPIKPENLEMIMWRNARDLLKIL
ncbi:amidohydrolase family protein [Methylobacterium nodulans]|uniref:Amidohydrolase 2 n=1 Tax=Methylobacterium nodulans (strain LMG 21967 / CNCM I-2342 / ORS 2060) TaxID=460265 RepID=B8IWE3_METNO|nr:amidohydrolase family protein [Methylobacterium nodulans]ACL62733.1 amidohydrolase 2 [Methylobacterium nodulans ORS 2060]